MSVCRVMRATSNLLCFRASMARSNSTLSGCLEPTSASGLFTFWLVHETANNSESTSPSTAIERRIITYLEKPVCGQSARRCLLEAFQDVPGDHIARTGTPASYTFCRV